jgi:hypothetical protein
MSSVSELDGSVPLDPDQLKILQELGTDPSEVEIFQRWCEDRRPDSIHRDGTLGYSATEKEAPAWVVRLTKRIFHELGVPPGSDANLRVESLDGEVQNLRLLVAKVKAKGRPTLAEAKADEVRKVGEAARDLYRRNPKLKRHEVVRLLARVNGARSGSASWDAETHRVTRLLQAAAQLEEDAGTLLAQHFRPT